MEKHPKMGFLLHSSRMLSDCENPNMIARHAPFLQYRCFIYDFSSRATAKQVVPSFDEKGG
jgi:hypothetical protein